MINILILHKGFVMSAKVKTIQDAREWVLNRKALGFIVFKSEKARKDYLTPDYRYTSY